MDGGGVKLDVGKLVRRNDKGLDWSRSSRYGEENICLRNKFLRYIINKSLLLVEYGRE